MQYKYLSAFARQGIDPGQKQLGEVITDQILIGADRRYHHHLEGLIKRYVPVGLSDLSKHLKTDGTEQVRPKIFYFHLLSAVPQANEYILHSVFGGSFVLQSLKCLSIQRDPVLFKYYIESGAVSLCQTVDQ